MMAYTMRTDPQRMFLDVNSSAAITSHWSQPPTLNECELPLTDCEPREDEDDSGRRYGTVTEDVATQCREQACDE